LRIRAVYRHGRAESEGNAIAMGLNGTVGIFMRTRLHENTAAE